MSRQQNGRRRRRQFERGSRNNVAAAAAAAKVAAPASQSERLYLSRNGAPDPGQSGSTLDGGAISVRSWCINIGARATCQSLITIRTRLVRSLARPPQTLGAR